MLDASLWTKALSNMVPATHFFHWDPKRLHLSLFIHHDAWAVLTLPSIVGSIANRPVTRGIASSHSFGDFVVDRCRLGFEAAFHAADTGGHKVKGFRHFVIVFDQIANDAKLGSNASAAAARQIDRVLSTLSVLTAHFAESSQSVPNPLRQTMVIRLITLRGTRRILVTVSPEARKWILGQPAIELIVLDPQQQIETITSTLAPWTSYTLGASASTEFGLSLDLYDQCDLHTTDPVLLDPHYGWTMESQGIQYPFQQLAMFVGLITLSNQISTELAPK